MGDLRAKFRISEVSNNLGPDEKVMSQRLKAHAVFGDTPENKVWSEATPTATLEMYITNPSAFNVMHYGDEFFVDMTIVSAPKSAVPTS